MTLNTTNDKKRNYSNWIHVDRINDRWRFYKIFEISNIQDIFKFYKYKLLNNFVIDFRFFIFSFRRSYEKNASDTRNDAMQLLFLILIAMQLLFDFRR